MESAGYTTFYTATYACLCVESYSNGSVSPNQRLNCKCQRLVPRKSCTLGGRYRKTECHSFAPYRHALCRTYGGLWHFRMANESRIAVLNCRALFIGHFERCWGPHKCNTKHDGIQYSVAQYWPTKLCPMEYPAVRNVLLKKRACGQGPRELSLVGLGHWLQ